MKPDRVDSPLAARARRDSAGTGAGTSGGSGMEGRLHDTASARELLATAPLGSEVSALTRWFEVLSGPERIAVACTLIEKCPGSHAGTLEDAVQRLWSEPRTVRPTPGSDRSRHDLFVSFQAATDDEDSKGAAPNTPGTPGFRSYRGLNATSGVTNPSFGMNSFITPVGGDLYSQAFMPIGSGRQFTPWSVSQEIGRPKSAAAEVSGSNLSGSGLAPYQNGAWSTASPGAIGSTRSGGSGSASRENLEKRTWASLGTGLAQSQPTAIGSRVGTGASAVKSPVATSGKLHRPASPSLGAATAGTASGGLGVSSGARAIPGSVGASQASSSASTSPASSVSGQTPSGSKCGRSYTSSPAPSSPYPSKRTIDFMDPELLADVGAWLRSLRLHKYTENLSGMPWQEVVQLSDADLEARGVNALGARRKMLKMFEVIRSAQEAGQLPK